MKLRVGNIGIGSAIFSAIAINVVFAQQAPVKRNYEAEVQAAIQSAKTAAGFEHLGTLVRTCLLPQSGGENLTDNVPPYVGDPASAPARDTWYAAPAKVFDNLYFVGGKLHSSWALTTKEGIILIDTIYPYNSEELVIGRDEEAWPRPEEHQVRSHLSRPRGSHRRRRDAADSVQGTSRYGRAGLGMG